MNRDDDAFPSALQAALLMVAQWLVQLVVGAALYDARGLLGLSDSQSWALDEVLGNGVVFATVMHARGLTYRGLFHPAGTSMRTTALRLVPWVLLLVPALALGISAIEVVLTRAFPLSESQQAMFERMGGSDLATVLVACAIAPAVEEMFFRGIILRGFLRRYGRSQAIWAGAALFGLAHLNLYQFVAATLIGAVSGWLYARSRSLVPCIALHAGYNGLLTMLALLQPGDASSLPLQPGLWLAGGVLAAIGAVSLARHFDREDADAARRS
jgi:hypothetical protein